MTTQIEKARAQPVPRPTGFARLFRTILRSWLMYLFLVPSFGLLGLFVYFPAAQALWESFFDWYPGQYNDFVGLKNYVTILVDPAFWISWRNLLLIIVWQFTFPFVMPFIMAECIFNMRTRSLQGFFRVAVLVPSLVPGIVMFMLWKWMYLPDGGVNIILDSVGLSQLAQPWLGQVHTALPALLFIGFPYGTGAAVLIYLAGLSNISTEVIDASIIDGCSRLRRVIAIDLPNVMGVVRLFVILNIIDVFQEFGRMLAVTEGGPYYATTTPALYLYYAAFGRGHYLEPVYGQAAAIATILFVLILFFSLLGHRFVRSHYEFEGVKA